MFTPFCLVLSPPLLPDLGSLGAMLVMASNGVDGRATGVRGRNAAQ